MTYDVGVMILLFVLFLLLMFVYCKNFISTRNESEYKDIVELQTMLVADLLNADNGILNSIGKLRYFPDKSGFFFVLDFSGKLLVHGDYDGDISVESNLPFSIPTKEIVEIAKQGGGHLVFNYKGHVYQSFIYSSSSASSSLSSSSSPSPYIVCSGLYTDADHIQARSHWRRLDKTMLKRTMYNCGAAPKIYNAAMKQ